jgi:hypothetical protein
VRSFAVPAAIEAVHEGQDAERPERLASRLGAGEDLRSAALPHNLTELGCDRAIGAPRSRSASHPPRGNERARERPSRDWHLTLHGRLGRRDALPHQPRHRQRASQECRIRRGALLSSSGPPASRGLFSKPKTPERPGHQPSPKVRRSYS